MDIIIYALCLLYDSGFYFLFFGFYNHRAFIFIQYLYLSKSCMFHQLDLVFQCQRNIDMNKNIVRYMTFSALIFILLQSDRLLF